MLWQTLLGACPGSVPPSYPAATHRAEPNQELSLILCPLPPSPPQEEDRPAQAGGGGEFEVSVNGQLLHSKTGILKEVFLFLFI